MTTSDLESVAQTLVAEGKGILAADETIPTLTRRFDILGILSNEESRHRFRSTVADQTDHADADHRRRQVTGRSAGATGQAGGDGCDRRGAQEFGTLGAGGAS